VGDPALDGWATITERTRAPTKDGTRRIDASSPGC
jgi:hypothetical protein